jgi:branched-chain amino acid transport system substrate-binding protein
VVGYTMMQAIGAAITRAKSTDTERLITAFRGLRFTSPFGPVTFRALDHQSTMGAFVGKLAVRGGKGTMVDWRYAEGAKYLPSDAEVRKRRPADAMT